MSRKRILHIEVSSLEESLNQFKGAWKRAVRGERVTSYRGVAFESMAQLLATITPRRWELIERLRRDGPLTVYALAKLLGRNYKNVHGDVKALEDRGLIARVKDGRVEVPWDEVAAHMRFAA